MLKRGQKVKVVGVSEEQNHFFCEGTILTVQDVDSRLITCQDSDGLNQVMLPEDVVPIQKSIFDDVRFTRYGNVTVCSPIEIPIGVSVCHPNDENDPKIGEALAFMRLMEKL